MKHTYDGRFWITLILAGLLRVNAIPADPLIVLKEGSNATLPCPLAEISRTHCHWLHNGQVINITQQCDQWIWEDASDDSNCSLRILSAHAEVHEGTWECVGANQTRSPIYLTVREPNTLKLTISRRTGYLARTNDGRIATTSGTQITANCSASGLRPGDKMQWVKVMSAGNNHSLSSKEERSTAHLVGTENVQVITQPTMTNKDNQAQLVCSVLDSQDKVIFRKKVSLEVFFGPQYTLERSSSLAHPGMQVKLRCPLHSSPRATYKWSFLAKDGHWVELPCGDHRTLQLDEVNLDQAGFYNCTATNSILGQSHSASELLYLNVAEGETPYRSNKVVCTLRGRVREHVTLLCPAPATPFTATRWFFQGDDRRWVPLPPTEGQALTMININASQAGLYKCVPQGGHVKDGCGFIYLSLGQERMIENLQNVLGLAFCVLGIMVFVGLLAFVVQISKIKAVLRVQERHSKMLEDQASVWTCDKVGVPYYSLPPAYSTSDHPAAPLNNFTNALRRKKCDIIFSIELSRLEQFSANECAKMAETFLASNSVVKKGNVVHSQAREIVFNLSPT